MKKEDVYRTMVNVIGAMDPNTKNDDSIIEYAHYKQAKEYYDTQQYDLLLIYSLALVDEGNEIKFINPILQKWQKRVKELKAKKYNALSIVNIMSEEL